MHAWSARRLCIRISLYSLCTGECLCLLPCQHLHVHVCVCACVQVTLTLPDQMCRSLDCREWWVAPSLTLQTWNNAHRSLQLMSSLYREHTERASTLPTVSIRASISGEQSFLCSCWRRTKELDTKCKSASSTWGGSSLFVSQGGEWQVLWIRME